MKVILTAVAQNCNWWICHDSVPLIKKLEFILHENVVFLENMHFSRFPFRWVRSGCHMGCALVVGLLAVGWLLAYWIPVLVVLNVPSCAGSLVSGYYFHCTCLEEL